jgi:hypothetical protein
VRAAARGLAQTVAQIFYVNGRSDCAVRLTIGGAQRQDKEQDIPLGYGRENGRLCNGHTIRADPALPPTFVRNIDWLGKRNGRAAHRPICCCSGYIGDGRIIA